MNNQGMSARWEAPRGVCIAAIGLGCAGLAAQCAIDVYQAITPGMDIITRLTQAWQMILPSGYKMVLAALCGVLLRYGHWFKSTALFGLAAVFMVYSASNSMDFLANQSVAQTKHQIEKATVAKDIATIQNDTIIKERKEATENLWRTYMVAKPGDREKILDQIKGATQAPVALQTADVDVVQVGIGGTLIRYGIRPEALQELRAVIFPVSVVVASLVCISMGFAGWPKSDLWRKRKPVGANPAGTPETFRKSAGITKVEARNDIIAMVSAGSSAGSAKELSQRWRVPEGTVSKWLKDFKKEGLIRRGQNGNARSIIGALDLNGKMPVGSA